MDKHGMLSSWQQSLKDKRRLNTRSPKFIKLSVNKSKAKHGIDAQVLECTSSKSTSQRPNMERLSPCGT
jgi:hypothetical protein